MISKKDILNFRIARYADNQYIEILKKEIVNALVLKRIKLSYDTKNKYVIGDWERIGVKFLLSEDMSFVDFIK